MKLVEKSLTIGSLAKRLSCGYMALLLATGTALCAEDNDAAKPQHHAGAHISIVPSLSTPDFAISAYDGTIYTSDIVSDSGYIFGFFWEMPFGKWVSGRLTFDYGVFGSKEIDYMLYSKRYTTAHLGLMYDVQLYLNKSKRFYIFGGLGYYDRSIDEYLWGTRMRSYDISSDACTSLGVGVYIWKHVGFEFKSIISDTRWVQLSLVFRT